MNLILIGLRGSGKTTVGRMVAERLGRPFVDLDDVTARLLGAATVAEAWKAHGEPAFRAAEARALSGVFAVDGQIVALGGGTPTAPGAADLLRAAQNSARVIYLWGSAASLRERLAATDMSLRSSLTGADPLAEIESVMSRRDGLFRSIADFIIATDGHTPDEMATLVLAATCPDQKKA